MLRYCPQCNAENTVEKMTETVTLTIHDKPITVENCTFYKCKACGCEYEDNECRVVERAYKIYEEKYGESPVPHIQSALGRG